MALLKIRIDSRKLSAASRLFVCDCYGHSSVIPRAIRAVNGAWVIELI
ncbi:hypothetical protein [Sinorhizobium meliloti]|nr:hypothetical protein [Sinorhizobium meliloti]